MAATTPEHEPVYDGDGVDRRHEDKKFDTADARDSASIDSVEDFKRKDVEEEQEKWQPRWKVRGKKVPVSMTHLLYVFKFILK